MIEMVEVKPGGANSGKNNFERTCIKPKKTLKGNRVIPKKLKMFNGLLLKLNIPFFAHPIFLKKLFFYPCRIYK